MLKRHCNDTFFMGENYHNRCNAADFPMKQRCPNLSDKSVASPKKAVIRIMGRDYSLTLTTYKRIAIGIRIGQDSCSIEIAIVDSKSNELRFPMSTWKLLLQQEPEILQRFRTYATPLPQDPIVGDHLRIHFTRINGQRIVKISDGSSTIYMTEATIRQMFKYDRCIDHTISWLSEILNSVSSKYASFVAIIRTATTSNADYEKLISESEYCEPHSLLDCELLTLCLDSMINDARNVS